MKAVLETVTYGDQESVHAFLFDKKDFDAPWHFHPEYELTLILESSGIRYVGNNISDYKAGDLVLLGKNLPHCWKNEASETERSRSLVLQWQEGLVHRLSILDKIHQLLNHAQRGLFVHPADRAPLADLMHEVVAERGVPQYLTFVKLLDQLATKTRWEYLAGASYTYDQSNATTTRLAKVQSYVNQHYRDKIKLSDVALELNMSEQAFSRFFSKAMNKPFFVFLNEYRVNISSRIILETDLQMAEIAYKCGYDSLPFFYKQFKKFKGYTPLEFRKMYQGM